MIIEGTGSPVQGANAHSEDPVALAEYAFRVAQQHCCDCHEYHAVWGYINLSGVRHGYNRDREMLQSLFGKLSRPDACILIAGAADDRLLAITAQATRQQRACITVVDRCRTPLLLCRRYADSHDVIAPTSERDLAQTQVTGRYELILVHFTLRFIPQARRAFFLRNLGLSLTAGGRLILVQRNLPATRGELATPAAFSAKILRGLSVRGVPLPEDEFRFRRRLETYAEAKHPRRAMDFPSVEACFATAGFCIRERIDPDRQPTISTWNGEQPTTIFTRIFVASFEG